MIGGSVAAAIVFLVLVMQFASAPSYSTLLTGLDPAQTGKITTRCRPGHRLPDPERRHRARGRLGPDGARRGSRWRRPGCSASQHAARLRAVQQLAARREQLPAAGHLPARARGPARADDRADPGRRLRHRPARAPQPAVPALRATTPTTTSGRGAAVRLRQLLDPSAVKGIAELVAVERPGPVRPEGDDHRLHRLSCCGRPRAPTRPDGGATSQQSADQQYDANTEAAVDRPACEDARPGQGAGRGQRGPQRQPGDLGHAHVHQQGLPLTAAVADRDAQRAAARTASGTTGTIPAYAATHRRATPTTRTSPRHQVRRRQDRHPRPSPRARSTARPSRCSCRQVGAGVARSRRSRPRSAERRRPERQARRRTVGRSQIAFAKPVDGPPPPASTTR